MSLQKYLPVAAVITGLGVLALTVSLSGTFAKSADPIGLTKRSGSPVKTAADTNFVPTQTIVGPALTPLKSVPLLHDSASPGSGAAAVVPAPNNN